MRWAGHVARMREMRNRYNIFVGKPKGNRSRGKPRCSWEDNIRIYIREIVWEGVDWIHLLRYRDQWRALVNTVMKLRLS